MILSRLDKKPQSKIEKDGSLSKRLKLCRKTEKDRLFLSKTAQITRFRKKAKSKLTHTID